MNNSNSNSNSNAYCIAIFAGILLCISNLATGNNDIIGAIDYQLSVVASGIMGYFYLCRDWRWFLLLFFTQLVAHSIFKGEIGNLWPIFLIILVVLALPAVAYATLAAWVYRRLNSTDFHYFKILIK